MTSRRKGWMAIRAVIVITVIILVTTLLTIPTVQSLIENVVVSPFQPRYPEEASFTLQHQLTVNANGGSVIDYTFDIALPKNESENGYQLQEVSIVSLSPQPTTEEIRYGQPWAVWQGGRISGNEAEAVSATYSLTITTHIWNFDQSTSGSVGNIPSSLKHQYLHDEWKINMTDSTIAALAHTIVGNDTDVYSVLHKIYSWMVDNIRYPSSVSPIEPKSAVETLESGVGKCDEQSFLFCSLARAVGVPAWLQLGAMYVGADGSVGGHAWVQTYVPNKSGGGDNVTIDVVNKEFLLWTPNHMVDFTDDGIADHLTDYYYTFVSSYDDQSYPSGNVPQCSENYIVLAYQESEKKVSAEPVYSASGLLAVASSSDLIVPSKRK